MVDSLSNTDHISIEVNDLGGVSSPYSNPSPPTPDDFETQSHKGLNYRRISYQAVLERVNSMYDVDIARRYSSAIDALASFVKGMKHMHIESQELVSRQLQILMIPALIASAVQPILIQADSIQCTERGKIIVGTLAGLVTCLIGVVSMRRLDARSEAYRTAAHQYDKLQSVLEFQSGQVLLFSDPALGKNGVSRELRKGVIDVQSLDKVNSLSDEEIGGVEKTAVQNQLAERLLAMRKERTEAERLLTAKMKALVAEVESKISDIKDGNQFPLPQDVLARYPVIANTNVFAIIKNIDDIRTKTVTDLTYVTNQLRYLKASGEIDAGKACVHEAYKRRGELIDTIIYLNSAYSIVDSIFSDERKASHNARRVPFLCLPCTKKRVPSATASEATALMRLITRPRLGPRTSSNYATHLNR